MKVSRPDLLAELSRRVAVDQGVRSRLPCGGFWPDELVDELRVVDGENTAWLRSVLDDSGWPGFDEVGEVGEQHVWLLAQHADRDVEFQRLCLGLLREAVEAGQASSRSLAYLTDRVRVATGVGQLYGTQYVTIDGVFGPQPIEDPDNLDRRRAQAGLEPAAEYDRRLRDLCGH